MSPYQGSVEAPRQLRGCQSVSELRRCNPGHRPKTPAQDKAADVQGFLCSLLCKPHPDSRSAPHVIESDLGGFYFGATLGWEDPLSWISALHLHFVWLTTSLLPLCLSQRVISLAPPMSNARRDYCTLDNLVPCSCWRGETAPANHLRQNLMQCGPFHHALPCLLQPPANALHLECCVHVAQLLLKPHTSCAGLESRPSQSPSSHRTRLPQAYGGTRSLCSASPLALL